MADYGNGVDGQVENDSYCMKKSWQARNVADMNQKMGYNNMSDLANTAQPPTKPTGVKANNQVGPKASNPMKNDRS